MRIQLIAVGGRMPSWVSEGYETYAKRLPPTWALRLVELPLGPRGRGADSRRAVEREGAGVLTAIADRAWVVALDERGGQWSSDALAARLESWLGASRDLAFLIGGPDGLSDACLARSDERWSLSALTLPHALVRIVVAEQLYRAWSILNRHPYHRA